MNQEELIKTEEQYQKVKTYVEKYILGLMRQKQIRRKDSLMIIKSDLQSLGYIPPGWKTSFFLRLFLFEPGHKGTDIDEWVLDLRRFMYAKNNPPVSRLPGFDGPMLFYP